VVFDCSETQLVMIKFDLILFSMLW